MEERGKKITVVLCGNLDGEILLMQLIYAKRCYAVYDFPDDWNITHSANHWSNKNTMMEYIQGVIVTHVESIREELQTSEQAAMAIFDNFKGQITKKVLEQKQH